MTIKITEVRIKLTGDPRNKLKAFCSVTFDDAFVVRDLKVIEGNRGPFVAMPSRKIADRCSACRGKNDLRAAFCSHCGARLDPERGDRDAQGRVRLHADLAHPINAECRLALHNAIVAAYTEEVELSKQAGYKPKSFDDFDGDDFFDDDYTAELLRQRTARGSNPARPAAEGGDVAASESGS